MDEGNVDFNNEQYLSQSKNTSTEASNNQERTSSRVRICLIGDLKEDIRLNEAAQSFGFPVLYSDDGKEFLLNDGSIDTVFIFKEFSGPSFEAINKSEQRILGPIALLQCKEKGITLPDNTRPLYCLAMTGFVICFTGFRKKDELNELITLIHHMGGSIRKEMATKVTHLVANACGGNKYQYALTFRVPIMTSSWVHNCWTRRNEIDLNTVSDDLIIYKLRPFQGARVAFVGFPDDERRHMSEVLEQNGGIEVSLDDKSCTHVVVDSGDTYYLLKSNLIEPCLERRWSLTPSMSTLPLSNPSSSSPNASTPYTNDRQPLRLSLRSNQVEDLELSPITELPSPPHPNTITTTPTTRRSSFRQSFFKVPSSVRRLSMRRKSIKLSTAPSLPSSEPSEVPTLVSKTDDFNLGEENRPMVVDESSVQTVPEQAPLRAPIVKAEWFWASVQNEGCAEEKDYLFEDYLEMALSPSGRRSSAAATSTPTGWSSSRKRKRKRLLEAVTSRSGGVSAIGHLQDSPGHHKRRSSVSDAGLLSVSGSFLDSTASPDVISNDEVEAAVNADTPRKALSPRQQVFLELVQTESNYVGILHTIMTMFKLPLEEMTESEDPLLNNTELKIIFGNLPPIYEIHRKMLDDFKWAASHWKEDFSIGNTILKYSRDLEKAYPPFVNFFETSKETLIKCDETKQRFHAFLKVCQTRPECGRQTLQDLMIRPVQRLPSISLLLNDILKHTGKSNADHAALEQALNSIREVMTHINEDKRKTESQLVMFDIFNEIENCPPHLVSSHRSFITRCDVMEITDGLSGRGDQLVLFLFSDIMEVCKKRSKAFNSLKSPNANGTHSLKLSTTNGKPYKHIRLLPLSNIKRVIDIRETEECQRVFALMCRSNQELKEKVYSFTLAGDDEAFDKLVFLRTLCRQMANTVCKADAENFLSSLDPQQLDIETSLVAPLGGTLSKAMNRLAKGTRQKVGRAFSFNKTPSKLKRAVSSMMSPFGSTTSLTPASQLAQMRLASCNNLNELGSPAKEDQPTYVAPMSVQPIRKNKCASLGMASLKRL